MKKIKAVIADEVGKDITEESVAMIRASFVAHCKDANIDPHHQHGPRQIKISYRGQEYDHITTSYKHSFE